MCDAASRLGTPANVPGPHRWPTRVARARRRRGCRPRHASGHRVARGLPSGPLGGLSALARLPPRTDKACTALFPGACFREPSTHRSLVPSRGKPLSETWLICEDRRGSRRLARLRLGSTRHVVSFLGARASCPLEQSRAFGPLRARCPRSQDASRKTWLNRKDDGASGTLDAVAFMAAVGGR